MLVPVKYSQVMVMWRWFFVVFILFFSSVQAAELQGVGMFSTLNKPWFFTGLYQQDGQPARLEFRIVEEKIMAFNLLKLEKVVLSIAEKELKHIEILGGVLGFIIGLFQLLVLNLLS